MELMKVSSFRMQQLQTLPGVSNIYFAFLLFLIMLTNMEIRYRSLLDNSASNCSHLYHIPDGDPAVAKLLPNIAESTHFFSSTDAPYESTGHVLDAVTDYQADNTGKVNSSRAIQVIICFFFFGISSSE